MKNAGSSKASIWEGAIQFGGEFLNHRRDHRERRKKRLKISAFLAASAVNSCQMKNIRSHSESHPYGRGASFLQETINGSKVRLSPTI
jgi:hypothetical protein